MYIVSFFHGYMLLFVLPFTFIGFAKPLCDKADPKIPVHYLEEVKKRFIQEMDAHYSRLVKSNSISESQKNHYLEKFKNPSIKVHSSPQNTLQKIVYIEYETNWWGQLYFASVSGQNITQWIPIPTHGAVTECVRWNKDNSFFYQDSTHRGTKTQNTCSVQNSSIDCRRIKK